MQTNTSLSDRVIDEITLDPRIPSPEEIAVQADGDRISLRGTVKSFAQRRAAVADAKRVLGVDDVADEITVNLLGEWRRGDHEIKGIALQNLIWDVEVPSDSVHVKVEEGWLTLSGTVQYQYQSDAAFDDVASLYGLLGVTNEIKVVNP
jgi:osmotically-inducible protein OsmY